MIPRVLHVRNFLSYRECTVDFTGLHLAVLSGRNGDGKSALLDGITWALWGKARGSTVDDPIFQGADEMLVDLEFEVEGDVFAVLRKRSRGKSSSVSVYQLDEHGNRTTRTGGIARQTQDEINRLLRMDYETFFNSAFIAQGRADEFTRKGPGDRKEIFRKVLGLERYQEYADAARIRNRSSQGELSQLRKSNEENARDIQRLPEVITLLERATAERTALEGNSSSLEAEVAELQQAVGQYRSLRAEAEASEKRAREAQAAVDAFGRRIAQLEGGLAIARTTVASAQGVEAAYARHQLLRRESDEWNNRLRESAAARDALNAIQTRIDSEQARLEAEFGHLADQLAAAGAQITRISEFAAEESRLAEENAALKRELDRALRLERDASESGRLEAEAKTQAKHALDGAQEIKERERSIEHSTACPVCLRPLTAGDAERVRAEYASERKRLGEIYHDARARETESNRVATLASGEAAALRKSATVQGVSLESAQAAIRERLGVARESERMQPTLAARSREVRHLLDTNEFAKQARVEAGAAAARLAECAYDDAAHRAVRDELKTLGAAEQRYLELKEAQKGVEASEEALAHARDSLAKGTELAEVALAALLAARQALESTDDLAPRLDEASNALSVARSSLTTLVQQVGGLENERTRLIALSARLAAQRDVEKALAEEVDVFGALSEGFGPGGVQAMLIDQSSPLLETYANEMLDRMTGGRIHLQFATSRQLKDGRSVETLDIRISDEMGTKDYEMYSGGERFRVDFAIRIALARLLADRAGASLPTLIIDEGFGSQDQEGIDRLVEALTVIKDDFRLILLVTHIDELKERFNQRIEVTKDPVRGSMAVVV